MFWCSGIGRAEARAGQVGGRPFTTWTPAAVMSGIKSKLVGGLPVSAAATHTATVCAPGTR